MRFTKRMGWVAGIMGMTLLAANAAMAQAEIDPDHFPMNPASVAPIAAPTPSAAVSSDESLADPGYAASVQQASSLEAFLEQASSAENMMISVVVAMALMIMSAIGLSRRGKRDRKQYRMRALHGAA